MILFIFIIIYLYNFEINYIEDFVPVEALTKFDDIKSTILLTKKVNDILKRNNITYWMIGGTLLGAVRNKGMITWDDDADIAMFDNMGKKLESIKDELEEAGLGLVPIYFGYKIFNLDGRRVGNNNFKYPFLDIFVCTRVKDKIILKDIRARNMWPDEKYNYVDTFPLKEWEYEDFKLMGPNNPFPLLNKIYPKWETKGEKPNVAHVNDYGMEYTFDLVPSSDKPYIWIYYDDIIVPNIESVRKYCSKDFNIIIINKNNIMKWLPEINNYNEIKSKSMKQKINIYRTMLLYKYGGIYIQPNINIINNLSYIITKLKKYDFVKMDNLLFASRSNTRLMGTILKEMMEDNNDISTVLEEMIEDEDYEYYDATDIMDKYITLLEF